MGLQHLSVKLRRLILAGLCLCSFSIQQSQADLPSAGHDLTALAREAQDAGLPILLLFASEDCGYCERLIQEVLLPFWAEHQQHPLAIIREMDFKQVGKLTDFDGELIRSRHFRKRYQVFATPTLVIIDTAGHLLADPIAGYDSKEAYTKRLNAILVH